MARKTRRIAGRRTRLTRRRRQITYKKQRVGGRPPGLHINTSSFQIETSLTKKEIGEYMKMLHEIENVKESYALLESTIVKLMNTPGAISRDVDLLQLEMLKDAAEKHHDKPIQIANVLIGVLDRFTPV